MSADDTTTSPSPKSKPKPDTPDTPTDSEQSIADRMTQPGYTAAVILLSLILAGAFAFVVVKLIEYADNPSEVIWGRRLYLYEGLFSLISAVVGAVFATTVYRPQLRKAREDAGRAQRNADRNAREAGGAREHGRAKAEEARTRILEEVGRRATRRPTTLALGPERVDQPDAVREAFNFALESDEAVYFSRGPGDVPEPELTLADVVEAIEVSRREDDETA